MIHKIELLIDLFFNNKVLLQFSKKGYINYCYGMPTLCNNIKNKKDFRIYYSIYKEEISGIGLIYNDDWKNKIIT